MQLDYHELRAGAPSGGRTHTGRILSPLPLPLGYRGHVQGVNLPCFSYYFIQLMNGLFHPRYLIQMPQIQLPQLLS